MMNYEAFKEAVTTGIKDYLPDEFDDFDVKINLVNKVNAKLEAMSLVPKEIEGIACPNMYFKDYYDFYSENGRDIDKTLKLMAGTIIKYTKKFPDISMDFADRKDKIIMQVINTEKNFDLLSSVPHKDYLDLSAIYRIVMNMDEDGLDTVILTNEMMDNMNITEQELYELAQKNTQHIMPATFMPMTGIILGDGAEFDQDELLEFASVRAFEDSLICTSNEKIMGAYYLFDPTVLETIAKAYDNSYYIIPSSIHELIIVPDDERSDPKYLSDTIKGVNSESALIDPMEVLSDNLYYYDSDSKELKLGYDKDMSRDSKVHEEALEYGRTDIMSARQVYFDLKNRTEKAQNHRRKGR